MNLILVYITNPSVEEAKKIANALLDKKLVACANIYSGVNSLYPWKGELADETEVICLAKTVETKFEAIVQEVSRIHSYRVPCVIKIPVTANDQYFDWVRSVLFEQDQFQKL